MLVDPHREVLLGAIMSIKSQLSAKRLRLDLERKMIEILKARHSWATQDTGEGHIPALREEYREEKARERAKDGPGATNA